jgi:hypothetical protein
MDDERAARLAENEVLFRRVNEVTAEVAVQWHAPDEPIEFRCECARMECHERVPMVVDEYEYVRRDPQRFFVIPGHEQLEIERIVGRRAGYVLVEKIGAGRDVAAP